MTLEEFYNSIGEDYDEVFRRLGSEKLIKKVLTMLLRDESFELLCSSLEQGNYEEAFRASHTLKGILMNMGFGDMSKVSIDLTDALREKQENPNIEPLFKELEKRYRQMLTALKELIDDAD